MKKYKERIKIVRTASNEIIAIICNGIEYYPKKKHPSTKKTLQEAFEEAGFKCERSVFKWNKKVHRDVMRFLKRKEESENRSFDTKMRFD